MSKERNIIIYDKAYEYLNNEIKPPEVELTKYFLCDECHVAKHGKLLSNSQRQKIITFYQLKKHTI